MSHDSLYANGAAIKARRVQRGWKQESLSERTGLSLRAIQKAEASERVESETLETIALALECDMADLQPESVRNKHRARLVIEEILNKDRLDLIDEIYAEDFVGHDPTYGAPTFGRDQVRNLITQLKTAFPDLRHRIESLVAEDDQVAIRWTLSGTHFGQFSSYAPQRKRFDIQGFSLIRFENGQIKEGWQMSNYHDFLAMIGAMEPVDKIAPQSTIHLSNDENSEK